MAKRTEPREGGAERLASKGRRRLLALGGVGVVAAAAWPVSMLLGEAQAVWRPGPFGPLRPDPEGVLDLPEGFTYQVLDRAGERMTDGLSVPSLVDGMACFDTDDGALVLVRNHEYPPGYSALAPVLSGAARRLKFDDAAHGSVSRVVLDASTLEVRSRNLVLAGTATNCSGGRSPWGWLSCEENVSPGHGYVFVCDARASSLAPPRPVRGYGRFMHEAAVVDPATSIAYLTEDRLDACFYRFVPRAADDPFEGTLSALTVPGHPRYDTGRRLARGESVEIGWVEVTDPDPEDDVIRHHAHRSGAALVRRGEGMHLDLTDGRPTVYFTATLGGVEQRGQVFRLAPEGEGGLLTLVSESSGHTDFDMPDAIAVTPSGAIFFAEDHYVGRNYVRGVDRQGRVFDFARNVLSFSEITGVTFAPDGRTMFLGLQRDGLTLAVRGAFDAA